MSGPLREILQDLVLEEKLALYEEAHQTLDSLGLNSHNDELLNIQGMYDSGESDTDQFVARVHDLYNIALRAVLTEFGVTIGDQCELPMLMEITRAVCDIEFYVMPDEIAPILESDRANEEILTMIIPILSHLRAPDVFDQIEVVRDSTIERIRNIITEKIESQTEDEEYIPHPEAVEKCRAINLMQVMTKRQYPNRAMALSEAGQHIGTPLKQIMTQDVVLELDEMDLDAYAFELMGLILYSDVDMKDVERVFMEEVKEYSDYPSIRRNIVGFITPFLKQLFH